MIDESTDPLVDPTGAPARVLVGSLGAFTTLFSAWLMLGVLGVAIKQDPTLMLGASARGLAADELQRAVESRFEWLLAAAILAGSLPRLAFGIGAERYGGRTMMVGLLLFCAIPTYLLGQATSYRQLLACALGFGMAGNAFAVGIAWNSLWFAPGRKGLALGIFGAGTVGAAGTKLLVGLAPGLLTVIPPAGYLGGLIPGGWRFVPTLHAGLLILAAGLVLLICPAPDRKPAAGRSLAEAMTPLGSLRVWRFGLEYGVFFGAYVALSSWLPSFYRRTYRVELGAAALLTASYIFTASLARPLGGYLADRLGPGEMTCAALVAMSLGLLPLCLPTPVLDLGVAQFTALLVAVGAAMGIGKGAVFKAIPDNFPDGVGAVGGLVGTLGAVGGFLLPPAFGIIGRRTGSPQSAFLAVLVLAVISLAWLAWGDVPVRRPSRRGDRPARSARPCGLSPEPAPGGREPVDIAREIPTV